MNKTNQPNRNSLTPVFLRVVICLITAMAALIAPATTVTWDGGNTVGLSGQWNVERDNWDSTNFVWDSTLDLVFYSSLGSYANPNVTFIGTPATGLTAATCRSLTFNANVNAAMVIKLDNNAGATRTLLFDADAGSASLNVNAAAQGSLTITRTSTANGQVQLNDNLVINNASPNFPITFLRPIANGPALVGDGGVTKAGVGTVVYGIANTYTGPTVVSGGRLTSMATNLTGGGAIAVTNSGTLELVLSAAGQQVTASDLSLGDGSGGTVTNEIDYASTGNGTVAVINATTSFSTYGTTVLKIKGTALSVGQFPLIQYGGGSIGGSGFGALQLGTLPAGVSATLSNNATASTVDLVITAAPSFLSWLGGSGPNWDIGGTANWSNRISTATTTYNEPGGVGANVFFDDAGTTTFANITTTVQPATLTVEGALNYQFGGAGQIGGPGLLAKTGTGTLTLSNANSFAGGSSLAGGRVALGNNGALGVGTISLAGGGLSSLGSATRTVTNAVVIGATTTFGDPTDNGAIVLSGPVTFNNGNRDMTNLSDVVFSGSLSAGGFAVKEGPGKVTINTTGGAQTVDGGWQIRQGNWTIDGASITKIGTGSVRIMNAHANETSVFSVTNGGSLQFLGATPTLQLGDATGDVTGTNVLNISGSVYSLNGNGIRFQIGTNCALAQVNLLSGGSLQILRFNEQSGGVSTEVNFNGGTVIAFQNSGNFMTGLGNAFVRSGGGVIDASSYNIAIDQGLLAGGGNGGLTKIGTGRLDLNGTNTYTGNTVVSAGTLGGSGTLAGPLQVNASGTLSAGAVNAVGTLTISNNLTLAGTVRMDVDASGLTSDLVTGLTNVTYGGTLVVTNLSGTALAIGQTYTLFSASGTKTANFSSVVLEGTGASGLTGTFNPATGELTIGSATLPQPMVTQVSVSGGNLILQGTNGAPSGTYAVLTSTNVTLPLSSWTTNTTGSFTGGGTFSNSIPITSEAKRFFVIKQP